MKKLLILAAALLLVSAVSSPASAQEIQQINIIDSGIYRALRIQQADAPDVVTGVLGHVDNLELVEATATIPALQGVRFGFRFKIIGNTGANVRLKFVIRMPQPGIQRGGTRKGIIRTENYEYLVVGESNYLGYKFDYPWEIVLGKWTLEVWDGSRRLVSQSFDISASV